MKIDLFGQVPSAVDIANKRAFVKRVGRFNAFGLAAVFSIIVLILLFANPELVIFDIIVGLALIAICCSVVFSLFCVDNILRLLSDASDSACVDVVAYMEIQDISDYVCRVNQENRRLIKAEVVEMRLLYKNRENLLRQKAEVAFGQVYPNPDFAFKHSVK